jgi:hypothetical protein
MSGVTGLQPVPLYITYAGQESKYATASLQADTQSSAALAYFQQVAPTITTPDALLKNYKALSVVLGAFGLQDKIGQTAILRQLLTQDPTAKTSLAQTLGNAKFQSFANALSDWSTPPFGTASAVAQIASSYTTNLFEKSADTQAPGLQKALYFTRGASSLKSVAAIQSDQDLLSVVVTSLGLPLQNFEELSFDQQTSILTSKLTLSNLQDPAIVKRMAEQYLVQQQSTASSGPAPGSIAALYDDGSDTSGDALLGILNPSAATDSSDGSGSNVLSLFA